MNTKVSIPLLSSDLQIGLTDYYVKKLGLNNYLNQLYDEYSGFVHASMNLLQLNNYMSIIEYKLMKNEIRKTLFMANQALNLIKNDGFLNDIIKGLSFEV